MRMLATAAIYALGALSALCSPALHAQDRLEQILAAGVLRVCIWPDYYSISYRDPRTQKLSGIDIDLAHSLAAELGVAVEFVDSSFSRLIEDVHHGRCDVAMFAIGITPEREAHLSFTRPHLASDVVAITTRSNRKIRRWEDLDRPGIVIAVAKGTVHEPLLRARLHHATLITPDTPRAREQSVQSGRADAFIADFPYSLRMLASTDWARAVQPTETYHVTPYAWAVRPGEERWRQRLEAFMTQIKHDGRLKEAARQHQLDSIVVLD